MGTNGNDNQVLKEVHAKTVVDGFNRTRRLLRNQASPLLLADADNNERFKSKWTSTTSKMMSSGKAFEALYAAWHCDGEIGCQLSVKISRPGSTKFRDGFPTGVLKFPFHWVVTGHSLSESQSASGGLSTYYVFRNALLKCSYGYFAGTAPAESTATITFSKYEFQVFTLREFKRRCQGPHVFEQLLTSKADGSL